MGGVKSRKNVSKFSAGDCIYTDNCIAMIQLSAISAAAAAGTVFNPAPGAGRGAECGLMATEGAVHIDVFIGRKK